MATIYCPKCGTPNDSSSTFCGNCGYAPQASGAGTFYPPQGQQKGANIPPPPPPPFPTGNMPSSPTYPSGNMPSSSAYPPGSTPSSPAYPPGSTPSSPTYSAGNMPAPPTYPMGSTPSSPTYPTGTMPSSTYAGGGTNLPPPQPRRRNKGIIAIIAVVVVVILVAAGLVGFFEYKSHNNSGVTSTSTATPGVTVTSGATATPGVTATTNTTATPGATTTPGATATTSTTATPAASSNNYSAIQPGPGCDTNGGMWTVQGLNQIQCGTTISSNSNSRGYLYLQLPNASFSANNKISIMGSNLNYSDGYMCLGLAELGTNTGILGEYCGNGGWFIYSLSSTGVITQTLNKSITSVRTNEEISLTLQGNTVSFSIDTETYKATISSIQPMKVAITCYNQTTNNGNTISITNFSYITPAS